MLRSLVEFNLYESCHPEYANEFKELIDMCAKVYPETFSNMFEEWEADHI